MKPISKEDISQEVFDLYDDYAHNKIDRRAFVEKLSLFAVGTLTLPSLLSFMTPNYVDSILIKPDDIRIKSGFITYDSPKGGGAIKGLLSQPVKSRKKFSGLIIVHENRGLNPYIEDVGRRAAVEGFITLAPDALSPLGGYPGNDDAGRELQKKRTREEMLEDFIAGYNYLKAHPDCNGCIGVVGFCFGGYIANMMAVKIPNLGAAVPYYGGQPSAADAELIKAPILAQYASLDTRVNEGWPAYEAILKKNKVAHTAYFYEGVNHGFHNNTTPRYDDKAATLSWDRSIDFFKKELKRK